MNRVLKVTILLGCSVATVSTPLAYAGGQAGVNSQGDGGVQEAIRFERAKDAADARQARIEAARSPHKAAGTKYEAATGSNSQGDGGVQAAIQFEKAKNAADLRQARIQAGQAGDNAVVGSADRRVTGHK